MKITLHDFYGSCCSLDLSKEEVEEMLGTLNAHRVPPTPKLDISNVDESTIWVDSVRDTMANYIEKRQTTANS